MVHSSSAASQSFLEIAYAAQLLSSVLQGYLEVPLVPHRYPLLSNAYWRCPLFPTATLCCPTPTGGAPCSPPLPSAVQRLLEVPLVPHCYPLLSNAYWRCPLQLICFLGIGYLDYE
ncbi:hypothetical protein Aduo_016002 [Ancylostoma duodenale]